MKPDWDYLDLTNYALSDWNEKIRPALQCGDYSSVRGEVANRVVALESVGGRQLINLGMYGPSILVRYRDLELALKSGRKGRINMAIKWIDERFDIWKFTLDSLIEKRDEERNEERAKLEQNKGCLSLLKRLFG